jgi:hypothetical protein
MVRQLAVSVLVLALIFTGIPTVSMAAVRQDTKIDGTVLGKDGKPMANVCIQLKNLDSGQVAASTKSDKDGKYAFEGVKAGNYVVEVLDNNCQNVVATSAALTAAAAGGALTGIAVTVGAGAAAAGGSFFSSTAGILLMAGVGAGIVAVVANRNEASPTK